MLPRVTQSEGIAIMRPSRPHFLLFSEARRVDKSLCAQEHAGSWRFRLESLDGNSALAAADSEPGLTTERLDLLAVVRGLEALDQPSRVTLVTRSKYVSRGIRFGLEAWRDSSWEWEHFGRMQPVPNADLWRRVEGALQIHQVNCRSWQFETVEEPAAVIRRSPAGWRISECLERPMGIRDRFWDTIMVLYDRILGRTRQIASEQMPSFCAT